MNEIFNEDCLDTLSRNPFYHYALVTPPDFQELGLNPKKAFDKNKYCDFIKKVLSLLKPQKRVITVCATDRKYDRKIFPKHIAFYNMMIELGYALISQKIWCKSLGINYFRLNYAFIMTYSDCRYKQNQAKGFMHDVWIETHESYKGFKNVVPPLVIAERCISNYTNKGDVVFNPFMGTGTVAIAAKKLGRSYLGSEISEDTFNLAMERINEKNNDTDG